MIFKINNTVYPTPAAWDESYEAIETVNQSEAGTDLCQLVRANKLTVQITSNLTSAQKDTMLALAAAATVSVQVNSGAAKTMRMREFTANRVRYSERSGGDLWECTYKLTEV